MIPGAPYFEPPILRRLVMLSVSRVNLVRFVAALAIVAGAIAPFFSIGVNVAFACAGQPGQCGGG